MSLPAAAAYKDEYREQVLALPLPTDGLAASALGDLVPAIAILATLLAVGYRLRTVAGSAARTPSLSSETGNAGTPLAAIVEALPEPALLVDDGRRLIAGNVAAAGLPYVVHENIDAAEGRNRLGDDSFGAGERRDIGLDSHDGIGPSGGAGERSRRRLQRVTPARANDHARPFEHERPGGREPKPLARSRDDRDLVL